MTAMTFLNTKLDALAYSARSIPLNDAYGTREFLSRGDFQLGCIAAETITVTLSLLAVLVTASTGSWMLWVEAFALLLGFGTLIAVLMSERRISERCAREMRRWVFWHEKVLHVVTFIPAFYIFLAISALQ